MLLFSLLSIATELEAPLELDASTEGRSFRRKFPVLEPSIEGTSEVEGTDASQIIAVHPTVRLFTPSLKSIILSTLGHPGERSACEVTLTEPVTLKDDEEAAGQADWPTTRLEVDCVDSSSLSIVLGP